MNDERPVCSYEGADYYGDFWAGRGRDYEDLAERIAIRRLLPPAGRRLLDVGGGFGRLAEFYAGYEQAVVLDYSTSLLRQAQARLGRDGRVLYVAANVYALPFVPGAFDAVLMVRVMHHMADVPAVLAQIRRRLAGGGTFVLEFANKRHLKSIARYILRRQAWNPFDHAPYEFVSLNFDFHPAWMRARLAEAGFHVKRQLSVSHFRLPLLKRLLPARLLAAIDGLLQPTGRCWQLTPSVFCRCAPQPGPAPDPAPAAALLACPACGSPQLDDRGDTLLCQGCARRWAVEDGIYNFKAPLAV